jgi:hypothetical protein
MATTASTTTVMTASESSTSRTAPGVSAPVSACAASRDWAPRRRFSSRIHSVPSAWMPKPPTWISSRIVACPSGVQYVAVSTTASPVTQLALVAVNSATFRGVSPPPARIPGSMSRAVPRVMSTRNETVTVRAGGRRSRPDCRARVRATTSESRMSDHSSAFARWSATSSRWPRFRRRRGSLWIRRRGTSAKAMQPRARHARRGPAPRRSRSPAVLGAAAAGRPDRAARRPRRAGHALWRMPVPAALRWGA